MLQKKICSVTLSRKHFLGIRKHICEFKGCLSRDGPWGKGLSISTIVGHSADNLAATLAFRLLILFEFFNP